MNFQDKTCQQKDKIKIFVKLDRQFKFQISKQNANIINLSDIWEHTPTEILNHGPKIEVGIIMRAWVKCNKLKLEDFNSLLSFTADDFTPSGSLSYFKEKADSEAVTMMPNTLLKELNNLRRYNQFLILQCEYDYDDFDNPLDEDHWLFQTRGKFMKYVIYNSSDVKDSRPTSNQKLASFEKDIKREETAYPTLKDEQYFDGFSRS